MVQENYTEAPNTICQAKLNKIMLKGMASLGIGAGMNEGCKGKERTKKHSLLN